MSSNLRHPEDFSCYLDRDFSDEQYQEIRAHLEICPKCREELEVWRNIDAAFRSPEFELDVPPFLWQRIANQINGSAPQGWRVWTAGFGRTRGSLISKVALALGIVLAVTWAGDRIVRYRADAQIRAMITHSQPEWKAENPFERLVDDDTEEENPFQKVLSSGPRKVLRN
jgi:anti-sigma factor RsiW